MSDLRRSAVFVWRTTELNRRSAVELNEQIIAELRALVERLTAGQPVPAKMFSFEMLFGLCASGSVLLNIAAHQSWRAGHTAYG